MRRYLRHFFLPNRKDLAPNFNTDDGYVFCYLLAVIISSFEKVQLRRSRMERQRGVKCNSPWAR